VIAAAVVQVLLGVVIAAWWCVLVFIPLAVDIWVTVERKVVR
jgi:hypothetical protein